MSWLFCRAYILLYFPPSLHVKFATRVTQAREESEAGRNWQSYLFIYNIFFFFKQSCQKPKSITKLMDHK